MFDVRHHLAITREYSTIGYATNPTTIVSKMQRVNIRSDTKAVHSTVVEKEYKEWTA